MLTDICSERTSEDSKHEWMPYRWIKDAVAGYGSANTVMKLGEVICKYCLEKKTVE